MNPLPTRNSQLALRRADYKSVPEMLDYAARGETGITFYSVRGEILSALAWREVRERAQVTARRLIGAGFAAGERILITADTWPGFFDVFFGAQYAGLLPVPVSIPVGIGGKEAYLDQLRRQLAASGAVAAVGVDDLAGFLADATREFPNVRLHGGLAAIDALPEKAVDLRPLGPADLCYIQFSSGSTRHPHGVQITQSTLMANLAGMTGPAGLDVVPGDRAVSWLPLYHDMGLIGFTMAPLASQLSIDYLTPRDFARRPTQWLNLISRNRGTIAYSPSFGYDLATRRAANQLPTDLDLSSWRHAGIGGDMIRPDVLDRFAQTFERVGFDRKAFIPSYGMAEVCLAITFCPHGAGVRTDAIDRAALAADQRAVPAADPTDERRTRRFVLCGKVLPGHRLEVRGADGKMLADREVGRIFVKGPSIMPGYFDEPEATRRLARYRRPRLHAGRRGRRHRARQGPDHRQRPQCLAAGHRMGDRGPQGREERRFGGLLRRYGRRRAGRRGGAGARGGRGGAPGAGARRGGRGARGDRGRLRRRPGAADRRPANDLVGQAVARPHQGQLSRRPLRAQDRSGLRPSA